MLENLLAGAVQTFSAASSPAGCVASQKSTFFGLETWYRYLKVSFNTTTNSCTITSFDPTSPSKQNIFGPHSPFLLIGLAVIDDLLRVAGLLAIGFVIYGAIQYITSQGSADQTAKAQETILNALIGVGISVIAIGLVSFLGSQLGG